MRELFHEIASTLRNNKLRTALTGFAVSWGIFLLICLLGAGNGLMNSFFGNMEQYVSQSITVEGWRTSMPYNGYKENREIKLDQRDVRLTESGQWGAEIGHVSTSTSSTSVTLSLDGQTVNGWLLGAMPGYREQQKLQLWKGRFLNPDDLKEKRKVIVINTAQAHAKIPPQAAPPLLAMWLPSWLKLLPLSILVSYVLAVLISPFVVQAVGLGGPPAGAGPGGPPAGGPPRN